MKLEVIIDGKARRLDLEEPVGDGGVCEFVFESSRASADVRRIEPGVYSILIEGRHYEVRIETGPEGYYAGVNGRRFSIQMRDPRRLARSRDSLEASGRRKISSPMPGRVLRVLVKEGEQVAAGQGLLVVEAMKMQNEIRSPKAGRVVAVLTREGAAVTGGEAVAEVE